MKSGRKRRSRASQRPGATRAGASLAECLVVLALLFAALLVALMVLPRQRQSARRSACQRNLMQIGIGLALYEHAEGAYPTVPALTAAGEPPHGSSPLRALLETLMVPDLTGLKDPTQPPTPQPGLVPVERPVPGFTCPDDTLSPANAFAAPVSYRATTGDDPAGHNGAFAPGVRSRLADIEAGDGASFTAAFSERLLGVPGGPPAAVSQYGLVPIEPAAAACPVPTAALARDDAGSSWAEVNWRSTLYNHALPPNGGPSCIDPGGALGRLGASSAHPGGVNVLTFDGAVRSVTSTVAAPVWQALATVWGTPAEVPPERPRPQP